MRTGVLHMQVHSVSIGQRKYTDVMKKLLSYKRRKTYIYLASNIHFLRYS